MKKAISLFLAVLMMLSVFSVTVAFAQDDVTYYTVIFANDDGTVFAQITAAEGEKITAPDYPVKEETSEMRYIFKGWKNDNSETLYHQNTIPEVTGDTVYIAVYSEQEKPKPELTFFGLIAEIFANFNKIFARLAQLFPWLFA